MRRTIFALLATLAVASPAMAITITARVSGSTIPIHSGPSDRYTVLGYLAEGTEIPIDHCTQNDSDSRYGGMGDAGNYLRGSMRSEWCRIPDQGWVNRAYIAGRGLVNVTPPDFNGPGW